MAVSGQVLSTSLVFTSTLMMLSHVMPSRQGKNLCGLLLRHVCDNGGICGERGVCMCGNENRDRVFQWRRKHIMTGPVRPRAWEGGGEERMLVGGWKWDKRRGLHVCM